MSALSFLFDINREQPAPSPAETATVYDENTPVSAQELATQRELELKSRRRAYILSGRASHILTSGRGIPPLSGQKASQSGLN